MRDRRFKRQVQSISRSLKFLGSSGQVQLGPTWLARLITLLSLNSLLACASLGSVSMSSIPQNRSRKVSAEASKLQLLGFGIDNDFVYDLSPQLSAKCHNGRVGGILTQYTSIFYILFTYRLVKAQGYCIAHHKGQGK